MLEHGGGIRRAAARFGIAPERWLDLSTGINPRGWTTAEAIPAACWSRLPEDDDGLEAAARAFYGVADLLPLAGSQAAIQALPRLRPPCRVGVLAPTYAEHPHAWRLAGHQVVELTPAHLENDLDAFDVVVAVNPNNPTGRLLPPERLLDWRHRLAQRGGWLLVDEAFIDATPARSLARAAGLPGLILLRSLGKFFGLAGARVGFLMAEKTVLQPMRELLGPWTLAGPSRWLATAALADTTWQAEARQSLPEASARLATLLTRHGLPPAGGTVLFQWAPTAAATARWTGLAEQGLLVRRFSKPDGLRFGLPGGEGAWQRLEQALGETGPKG